MQAWVVNFFYNGSFGDSEVFKSKEILMEILRLRGYEVEKVRFEKSLFPGDDREVYVRYYPMNDDRGLAGELQYIKE